MCIEDKIGNLLCEKNYKISIAESLTGGLLCGRVVNYPGISKVLVEGIVSYSVDSKIQRLGVKKETIERFTDVSSEVAIEMAVGVSKEFQSNIGISTTGNAGPTGDPVGLVYIGFYVNGETSFIKLNLDGDRQAIRNKTVEIALNNLYEKML